MENISFDTLISEIKKYNPNIEDLNLITKAYNCASFYHENQYRESGEPYIIHPLWVAYIVSTFHADANTICAALLHDTLEDTKLTKEDIIREFNTDVASLVEGVTNIKDLDFGSSEELYYMNIKKIMTSIKTDARIIIIKLADRLHNMRTLNYKKDLDKQKKKALETMEIYVPFAYNIGTYRIKCELEDLAFKNLYPSEFEAVSEERQKIEEQYLSIIEEMKYKVDRILSNREIPHEIRIRIKNVYGIYYYKTMHEGSKITDIHDLLALKIIVDNIDNCYTTLGMVHSLYKPIPDKVRDYIYSEKSNMYQSIHTTLYAGDVFAHTQIRTFEMDKTASFGLPALWDKSQGDAREKMQKDLAERCKFFNSLVQMEPLFPDAKEFVNSFKSDVLSPERVRVFTPAGIIIDLPLGATLVDYALNVNKEDSRRLKGGKVNGSTAVGNDYVLQNKDQIRLVFGDTDTDLDEMERQAKTSYAKKLIMQLKATKMN